MEHIYLNKIIQSVGIPYDDAPFEIDLKPGERIRLYGSIYLSNDADEEIHARVRFDLKKGFFLTVDGLSTHRHAESYVGMHEPYVVKSREENLEIRSDEPVDCLPADNWPVVV